MLSRKKWNDVRGCQHGGGR